VDHRCNGCGVTCVEGENCQQRYHECLALEFSNIGYGKVHHLTVPAFQLQHCQSLSLEGVLSFQKVLQSFLIDRKTPEQIRIENKRSLDQTNRNWRFSGNTKIQLFSKEIWTSTIFSVRMDNAQEYCDDITKWAETVLSDSSKHIEKWIKES
jgi:hypothetical protein